MEKQEETPDFEFTISNVRMYVEFEDGYFNNKEKTQILNCVEVLSKEICIDKSYVMYKDNPCKNAFIYEETWNMLNKAVKESDFFLRLDPDNFDDVYEMFCEIVIAYINVTLLRYTKKVPHLMIDISEKSSFDVFISESTGEYKNIIKRWQFWDVDENGNLIPPKIFYK